MKSSKKIGDPSDLQMRQIEIEEYLRDHLKDPKSTDRLLSPKIYNFFKIEAPSMELSNLELSNLAQYIMEYSKHHKSKKEQLKHHISNSLDIKNLQEEAKRRDKILIIEVSSPHCHYCKKMDREVLSKPDVIKELQNNFILAEVNIEQIKLPKKLDRVYQHITPSFFFISKDGKILSSYPGSWTKSDFLSILQENLNKKDKK